MTCASPERTHSDEKHGKRRGRMEINGIFLERMREMLGEEYPRFLSALTEADAVRGARVNLIKRPDGEMPSIDGFISRKISYVNISSTETDRSEEAPHITRESFICRTPEL